MLLYTRIRHVQLNGQRAAIHTDKYRYPLGLKLPIDPPKKEGKIKILLQSILSLNTKRQIKEITGIEQGAFYGRITSKSFPLFQREVRSRGAWLLFMSSNYPSTATLLLSIDDFPFASPTAAARGCLYYVIAGHGWGTGYGVVARGHRLASANCAGYLRAVPGKRHLPGWSRFEPCLASEYILRSYRFCFCFAPLIATKAIKREKNDWEVFGDEGKKLWKLCRKSWSGTVRVLSCSVLILRLSGLCLLYCH